MGQLNCAVSPGAIKSVELTQITHRADKGAIVAFSRSRFHADIMSSGSFYLPMVLVAGALLTGCKATQRAPASPAISGNSAIPQSSAEGIRTDYTLLPPADPFHPTFGPLPESDEDLHLELWVAQCLGAQHSRSANLLQQERRSLCNQQSQSRADFEPFCTVINAQIAHERNQSAGEAGEAFLRLAEAQLQLQLLSQIETELSRLQTRLDRLAGEGVATASEAEALARLVDETAQNAVQLGVSLHQWNGRLKGLIGMDAVSPRQIRPTIALQPRAPQLDGQSEWDLARQQDPMLNALQCLLSSSADMPQQTQSAVLAQLDPRLGLQVPQHALIGALRRGGATSSPQRSGQLRQLYEARRQQLRLEVATALLAIGRSFDNLVLANARVERLGRQRELLLATREAFPGDVLAETNIVMEIHKALGSRITAAVDYEVALLQLRRAQAQLLQECCEFDASSSEPQVEEEVEFTGVQTAPSAAHLQTNRLLQSPF